MKIQAAFLRIKILIAYAFLPLIASQSSLAQEIRPAIVLLAERQNPERQVSFVLGETVSYKTAYTKKFTNGRITEITDSTVSFEHKDHRIIKVAHQDLSAFMLQAGNVPINLKAPKTSYNLDHVSIEMKNGQKISGTLISAKSDSLVLQVRPGKPFIVVGYTEIESVGIHKRGSGGLGALIGGIAGTGIGALIGVASRPSDDPSGVGGLSVPAGAILGFLFGTSIGAAIGSSNQHHLIQGDHKKFQGLVEKINKRLWTLKVSKVLIKS